MGTGGPFPFASLFLLHFFLSPFSLFCMISSLFYCLALLSFACACGFDIDEGLSRFGPDFKL